MQKMRYRVKGPVFVNGSKFVPIPGREVFVDAAPGLAGKHLDLVGPAPASANRTPAADPAGAERQTQSAGNKK